MRIFFKLIFLIVLSVPVAATATGAKSPCNENLQSYSKLFATLRKWGRSELIDEKRRPVRRRDYLNNFYRKYPTMRNFLDSVAPHYADKFELPSPTEFTRAFEKYLDQLQVPNKLRVLPGAIYHKDGNLLFVVYGREVPNGASLWKGAMDSQTMFAALDQGVMPISWDDDFTAEFDMYMIHHDLGHLAGLTSIEYLKTLRKFVKDLLALAKSPKYKLKFNNYVLNKVGVQNFFEDLVFIPQKNHEVLDSFLRQFQDDSGNSLNVNSRVFVSANSVRGIQGEFIAPETKAEIATLQKRYKDLGEQIINYRSQGGQPAAIANLQSEREGIAKEITSLINLHYGKWFEEIESIFHQTAHLAGGSVADGLTLVSLGYATSDELIYFWGRQKAGWYFDLQSNINSGFRFEDIELRLRIMLASLVQYSQVDLLDYTAQIVDRIKAAPAGWISEDQ